MSPVYISKRWMGILKVLITDLELCKQLGAIPPTNHLQKVFKYTLLHDITQDVYRIECSHDSLQADKISCIRAINEHLNNRLYNVYQTRSLDNFRDFLLVESMMYLETIELEKSDDTTS